MVLEIDVCVCPVDGRVEDWESRAYVRVRVRIRVKVRVRVRVRVRQSLHPIQRSEATCS